MRLSPRHAFSVWQRNATMYGRTWKFTLLPNFFEPVFYLTSIGIGVGSYLQTMGGVPYAEFLAPGLICVAAMNGVSYEVTYNVFVRMNFEKAYDAMLTTPILPDDILAGELLWALTRSTLYGSVFFLAVLLFGLTPGPFAAGALLVVPLCGLLFGAIGLTYTMLIPGIEMFSFYFTLFLTPLFLFSDVFFPIDERLSGGWLLVAEMLPLLHPVRLTRAFFRGDMGWLMLWDVVYILGVSALLLAQARRAIRKRLTT